ncbi:MAG: hypothetical protein P4L63_01550 [Candidatus Pacebacteria bacterium]|nr:hypothetical protein [Candidatus Paceibacterota bacterium]
MFLLSYGDRSRPLAEGNKTMAANSMLFKALLQFIDGLLHQLLVNLAGENGEEWYEQLGKFLRKEITWRGGLNEANAFAVVEGLEVPATKEPQPLCKNRVFYRVQADVEGDEDLLNLSAKASSGVRVLIGLTTQEGTNSEIFSKHLRAIGNLERLRLKQSQISAFCSEYHGKFRFRKPKQESGITMCLCTVDDEPIRKNLSNLRILEIYFCKNEAFQIDQRTLYVRKFCPGDKENDSLRSDGIHVLFPIHA